MMNRKSIFEALEREENSLTSYGVESLGVFGSFAREEQDRTSDIDFLVEFTEGEKTYRNFIGLKNFLEDLFEREVDLVTKSSLKPSLKQKVLEEVKYAEEA